MRPAVIITACLALGVMATVGVRELESSSGRGAPAVVAPPAVRPAAVSAPATPRCSKADPTSAAGYQRLWATLPVSEWGAADVSISVPLPDGRVLWLYGDTLKAGPMTHSSAIVQDGGCLHVVNGGAQLLPNIDANHIFWVDSARIDPFLLHTVDLAVIEVTGRAVTLTGRGPWDFKDGGYSQVFDFTLTQAGDVEGRPAAGLGGDGLAWPYGARLLSAAPDPGPMYPFGPHHFGYARHTHPEARLTSGRTLVTMCQNWDDGTLHPFADYRPIFSESA